MNARPCPCCHGTGVIEVPPTTQPLCACALERLDPRTEAQRRRYAYCQRVALNWLEAEREDSR